jgi:tRNA G18 (ribose-2'-O)-methylase SpoU
MRIMPDLLVQPITSLEGPELQPYRTMKRDGEHRKKRIFVAEGDKVVLRLLRSSFEVVSLLMPEKWLERLRSLILARPERDRIRIFTADRKLLEQLTGFSMYQGVLGVGRVPDPVPLESMLKAQPRPWLLAAVEDLTNSENLGGLVRNCAGLGVTALLVGESCSSPYLRRAVRSSMGAIFKLPVLETDHLAHTLMVSRRMGIRNIAAHPHTQKRILSHADLTGDCCIVFGSEGSGISQTVLDLCDEAVAIPMANEVDSLNVASSSSVFLYEAAKQQGKFTDVPKPDAVPRPCCKNEGINE